MTVYEVWSNGRYVATVREDFAARIVEWAAKHNLDVVLVKIA